MSRRPRTRRSRSILSSLNPFSSSVDRAMDFKRQGLGYSRGLRCEQLEDRRLLAGVDDPFTDRVLDHLADSTGRDGVAVFNLTTGQNNTVNGDQVFGTSSTIKAGVLYNLLRKIDADNTLTLNTMINVGADYGTTAGRGDLVANSTATLLSLAQDMIDTSDNWAANRLMDFVEDRYDFSDDTWGAPGTFPIGNAEFAALGLNNTQLNRYNTGTNSPSAQGLSGPGADYRAGFDNETTPNEFVSLLRQVHENDGLLSTSSYDAFWDIMDLNSTGRVGSLYDDSVFVSTNPGSWRTIIDIDSKAGSNTWTGNVGDFTDDPTIGDHFQRSEGGRVQLGNGEVVFYAMFVDEATNGDSSNEALACVGYELATEHADATVTITPETCELDDGRVLTVLGTAAAEVIEWVASDADEDEIDISVGGNLVHEFDADDTPVDSARVFAGDGADQFILRGTLRVPGLTSLLVDGGLGSDDIQLRPSEITEIQVAGQAPVVGDPGVPPGDKLSVDLEGVGNPVVPANTTNGVISSTSHEDVAFTSIEFLVISDRFENNETIATATILGSEPAITLNDLSIHDADDVDFFRITAHHTGKLIINALFDHEVGDIDIRVFDSAGSLPPIDVSTTQDDNEQIIIPVVSQESYFLEVTGFGDDTNNYDLEIENFAAPAPSFVDLLASSDTGMFNDDNITSDSTPTFLIQADLVDFRNMGINLLDAATIDPNGDGDASDATNDGAGVFVTLVNLSTGALVEGFANQIGGSGFLWNFTVPAAAALGAGDYFVSSAVQIVDGQQDPNRENGRAQLSDPLIISILPGGAAGTFSADLIASSDTGMFDDDNVTNKMSPAIQGVAPAGSKVRLYANGALVGQTVTGSDTSDVGIGGVGGLGGAPDDGLGLWEITTEPLADGTYDLTLEFEDAAGNVQTFDPMFNGDGQPIDIEIDTTEPNTPVLDLRNDTGENLADEITSDNSPDVSMTTTDPALLARLFTDNLKFRIYDRFEDNQEFLLYDSAQDATEDADNVAGDMFTANTVILETLASQFAVLNAGGNFAVNAAGELEDGVHNLKLEVEDRAGNISDDFLLEVFIDTVDPAAVTPNLLDSSDSGMFNDDNVTNKWSPAFDGVAEINNKVFVYATRINPATGNPFDGTQILIGEGLVGSENSDDISDNGLGRWEVTVEPLVDGVYDITVRFEDWAGNFTPLDESLNNELRIVIDKEAPNTPFLDLIDDTGRHDHDEVTKENEPVVTMTSTDPNIQLAQVLFDDNLKFRIYDRYENTAEFLLYDSAADAAEDAVNLAGDMFTANTFITETLAAQFIAGNPANAAVLAGGVLADGVHNLKLEVEDRAGNISHDFLLTVTVDTLTPPVSFGLPAVVNAEDGLDASSDSGVTTMPATYADRVTNDTTPALWGRAEANTIIRVYHDDDGDGVIDLSTNPAVGDTFLGQTVAVPFDGNDAYPDGFWHINSVLDLNQILGLPKDGVRQLLVTAEDLAGNPMPMNLEIADGVDSLNIFIDTQGPQVNDPAGATQAVHPTVDPTYDLFDPKPSENGFTPLIDQITIHVRDLPLRSNADANFLYEALKEDIAEAVGNYTLVGDHVGPIGITNVDVVNVAAVNNQQATATITLTFADFLPDDRYTLTVSDNLVDPAGNELDGESNASGPLDDPTFPSGDGVPGGAFVGRFTVDSRPEIGTFIPTTIAIDINGNFVWDPSNAQIGNDATNVDLTFTMDRPGLVGGGFAVHDTVFAGKFVGGGFGGGPAEGGAPLQRLFDQLGVYGYSAETGEHRWLIDLDSDGVTDIYSSQPVLTSFGLDTVGALPIAGNFDNDLTNGDEIGLYYAGNWGFDFNHNFVIEPGEIVANTGLFGVPIVGDFDGNGVDDVAVFNNNNFTFALSGGAFGAFAAFPQFQWGFSGVLERPVAADMDQDGIDDIGLFVPRNTAQPLRQTAEWYFLLSGFADQVDFSVGAIAHAFEPVPFGDDLYAEFGDELALPIVGNFDPPVVASEVENNNFTQLPGDFDNSGMVDEHDFAMWQQSYGETGVNMAADADGDGVVGLADYTMWREHVGMTAASGGDYDGSGAVDEGDYETWRNQFGQLGTLLAADGNGDGRVDMADFAVWRNNMGASASSLVFASAEYSAAQPAPVAAGLQASPAAQSTAFAAVGPALLLGDSQDEQQGPHAVLAVEALFADHADDLLLIADRLPTSDEGDTLQSDGFDEAEEQTERETDAAFAQL